MKVEILTKMQKLIVNKLIRRRRLMITCKFVKKELELAKYLKSRYLLLNQICYKYCKFKRDLIQA